MPSRFQQERFSPLAEGNPLRYNPDRFGKADVRSPCLPASSECNEVRVECSRPVLPEPGLAQPRPPATTLRPGSPHSKKQIPVPSRFQQERFSALAKGNPLRYNPGPFWESRRQEPLPSSKLRVQRDTRRIQPACFARAQARPGRPDPLPATTRQLPSGQVHPTASSRSPCRPDVNRKGSLLWPKVTRFDTTRTVLGKQTSGAPASSKLRVQRGTRRMQPACFARAQARPARPGPPTGDYPATTLRPGSPHSKKQIASAVQISTGKVLSFGQR